jgi:hypothetical protein
MNCWSRRRRAYKISAGVRVWYRTALVSLLLSGITCAVWLGVRAATRSVAPSIHVRWASGVSEAERRRLEERFQLVNGEDLSGGSWSYDLLNSRPEAIQALVQHPAVADTHDLDRARFTTAAGTHPGKATRWLWNRWATNATAVWLQWFLVAWLLVSAAAVRALAQGDVFQTRTNPLSSNSTRVL